MLAGGGAQQPCSGDGEILVLGPDGALKPFAEISPMTQALNRQLMFRRLHVAAEWRNVVEAAVRQLIPSPQEQRPQT